MIEMQTLAGPIAVLRAMTTPPTSARVDPSRDRDLNPPDPNAPVGPRPTFSATPLERLNALRPIEMVRGVPEVLAMGAYRRDGGADPDAAPALDRIL